MPVPGGALYGFSGVQLAASAASAERGEAALTTPAAAATPRDLMMSRRSIKGDPAALFPPRAFGEELEHLLPAGRTAGPGRDAYLVHRQHASSAHAFAGRHGDHGRAGQRQALLLRLWQRSAQEPGRHAGADPGDQRHLLHPLARRSLRRSTLPVRLRPLDAALEAPARVWSLGRTPKDGINYL